MILTYSGERERETEAEAMAETEAEKRDFLLSIYGDYLAKAYSTAAENKRWRLRRRVVGRV